MARTTRPVPTCVLIAVAVALCAMSGTAEEIHLRPDFAPGDSYQLNLSAITDTAAFSQRGDRNSYSEAVKLDYRARVLVLSVDARGFPTRERHHDVRLGFVRPDESGQLFGSGTSFEVRRTDGGGIGVFANGRRIERGVEKVVVNLLKDQFELGGAPALIEPGRPVALGEQWELDRERAKRLLQAGGVRVVEMGGPATAELRLADPPRDGEPGTDSDWVVRYRIPADWVRLSEMPEGSRASSSEAVLEGEIRLTPGRSTLVSHSSHLRMKMAGVAGQGGSHLNVPWRLETTKRNVQYTTPLDPVPASLGSPSP
ncbi:MAG: hypothetical protein QNK05_12610 [Myxococcota bacterium]|nr:hypothetical protein [Myxococcota bacterium]